MELTGKNIAGILQQTAIDARTNPFSIGLPQVPEVVQKHSGMLNRCYELHATLEKEFSAAIDVVPSRIKWAQFDFTEGGINVRIASGASVQPTRDGQHYYSQGIYDATEWMALQLLFGIAWRDVCLTVFGWEQGHMINVSEKPNQKVFRIPQTKREQKPEARMFQIRASSSSDTDWPPTVHTVVAYDSEGALRLMEERFILKPQLGQRTHLNCLTPEGEPIKPFIAS
jgi:hypothetical protein